MKIDEIISTPQTPQSVTTDSSFQSPSKHLDQPNLDADNGDTVDLRSEKTSNTFRKVDALATQRNSVANSIRIADEAMQNIGTHLDEMKTTLDSILKQYPPFPPGSEERVALLKHFSTLRMQIEALAIPPEDTDAQSILSASEDEGGTKSLVDIGGERFRFRVHRLPVDMGPEGLDIPELSVDAADGQIQDMRVRLEVAKKRLSGKQDRLAADAERII